MSKEDLEKKSKKAVLRIDDKLTDISNILRDLSMKLCYIIKNKKEYDIDFGYKGKNYRYGTDF